jgi:F-type H+-transporting ATPase subunit gamma
MSEGLIETKRRINSISSTEKITSAMKLVASVKLKRWRTLFDNDQLYYNGMEEVMKKLLENITVKEINSLPSVLSSYPDSTKKLYIVVTSTLGLCGGYNYNLYRKLNEVLQDDDEILFIGNKGYLHYKNAANPLHLEYINLLEDFSYDNIRMFRHQLVHLYNENKYNEVNLVYTKYINSLNFNATILRVLPLNFNKEKVLASENKDIIFEDNLSDVLNLVLPHYIDSLLYNKLIESVVCESASRRNAMENATNNADDIMHDLKIKYNKARQAQITQEIIEVTSGNTNK